MLWSANQSCAVMVEAACGRASGLLIGALLVILERHMDELIGCALRGGKITADSIDESVAVDFCRYYASWS